MFIVLRILSSCTERRVRAPGKCHLLHKYRLLVLTASLVRGILTHMSMWCDSPALCGFPRNKINITGIYEIVNGVARESFYVDMFVDNCLTVLILSGRLSHSCTLGNSPPYGHGWVWCNSGEWNLHRLSNRLSELLASLPPFGCSTFPLSSRLP